jgi:alkylation response protein AidB-like acyl-CoA dehydrogenase
MDRAHALPALTAEGAPFVEAAAALAAELAAGALAHDAGSTFAVEHLDKLRAEGFLTAPVPTRFGGGGVESLHDLVVMSSRLSRGDPATLIGVNMHWAVVFAMARRWRTAVARGEDRTAAAIAQRLERVVADDVVFSAAASEPSPQDLTRPATRAVRVEDGWVVDGRKVFATMAPHATILNVAVSYTDGRGRERYGFVMVPAGSPGVVFHDDWDALGMRASASGSVSFRDVHVGDDTLSDGFPVGAWSGALMDRYLVSGAFHAAVSLGIAEAAHEHVVGSLRARADAAASDPHVVGELSANVVDLTAMQASLAAAGRHVDDYVAAHVGIEPTEEASQDAFAAVQAAKAFLNAAAVRVVDRALALTGGPGYLAAHPLAKAWRDVRAGGFMHPLGANRTGTLLARTALGLAPA